ncbi:TPA: TraI domain-containing protein [Burkholderia vietnamiensis]|uniref:TraI domain-containing protein n=1 Tax=Burkholderia vietnamiensis TaxID=60552 RepID=UPI000752FB49|nr:TraI domain-containing protein [Burkholderia vietnamiensis]KVS21181.1 type VI secretion protein [Burkholderia vietnamiensis]MBR7912122.1 TraI domain-containing protein [Burkholderia vietnamiensis]MBR8001809.1 TraI domain-containing protein [Burkholderia vietnamiensis]MBR8015909.1 TraI domain-containing protein [Burkholderia vietnamiensis]MCA7947393.1 TraI domain-containing protein [Burkholderia vietnamiensis]
MSTTPLHAPIAADTLLERAARRIELLEQTANESTKAEFARKWLALAERCAEWFSSMPLSPELYREPGGAFRCTIETAFYAMRLAGGQKFGTNLPSEKRRRIEPQYNYGVFLAAICSRLDEPYRHFEIVRDADMQVWSPPVHGAVGPWLGASPYRVVRRAIPLPVERMRTGMLAQQLIGSELLAGLDVEVLAEVFGAINPNPSPMDVESLTHKVVRQAISTAAEFDRKAQRAVFEPVQFEVPSAIHVAAQLEPVQAPAPSAPQSAPTPTPTPTQPPAPTPVPAEPALATSPEVRPDAASDRPPAAPMNPGAASSRPPTENRTTGSAEPAQQAFEEVLKGAPRMIVELFRALRQDVQAGKAKVQWSNMGLVLPKRLVGSYGVASDTLIEHLRKRSLLLGNEPTEITIAPRAGELILERTT